LALQNAQALERMRLKLTATHEQEMEELRMESQKDYERTALRLSGDVETMEIEHRKALRQLKADLTEKHEKEMKELREELNVKNRQYNDLLDEVSNVRDEFALQAVQQVQEAKLEMAEDSFKKDAVIQEYEDKIHQILEQHEKQIKDLSTEYDSQIKELRDELELSKQWATNDKGKEEELLEQYEAKIKDIKQHYENEIAVLKHQNQSISQDVNEKYLSEEMEKCRSQVEELGARLQ
ncbi:unnamed protein product, partial [Porites lobata]